ncbi:hypothetical protein BH23GEM9_BH23GEM9_02670 [soil metagenome]
MEMKATLDVRLEHARRILRDCGSVCIGYSGGVDSVFLAKLALDTLGAENVLAVTGLSAAYPAVQREVAAACALQFGIPHLEVETHELADPRYAANPDNRCYYCKSELWPRLASVARERGLNVVLDGSNADDVRDYRPGFAAATENGVRSPLLESGLTKHEIRELSREAGLPTWDQPASPCLSSRLPYGVAVTPLRLRQVELAEAALRDLGFMEFRVRHHDDCMRLEFAPRELDRAEHLAVGILSQLAALRLPRVVIDVEGYRRGALNEVLIQLTAASDTNRQSEPVLRTLPRHEAAGHHHDVCVVHGVDMVTAREFAPQLRANGFRYVTVDPVRLQRVPRQPRSQAMGQLETLQPQTTRADHV